jgi:hypothetical protein
LELENSSPSPILVKKQYKELMNRFANEKGVEVKPKKKKSRKKELKNLTPEEQKI